MADLETRLPDLLRDLSTDAPTAIADGSKTLRRARGRRALNASAGAVLVIVLVVGSFAGLRAVVPGHGTVPTATRTSAVAIWPETTIQQIDGAERLLSGDALAVRRDPEATARAFAVDVMGWRAGEVVSHVETHKLTGRVTVDLTTRDSIEQDGPIYHYSTAVTLEQLGATGPKGIWSVVRADSVAVTLDGDPSFAEGRLAVSGRLAPLTTGGQRPFSVWVGAFDGFRLAPNTWDVYDGRIGVDGEGRFAAAIAPAAPRPLIFSVAEFGKDGAAAWMVAFPLGSDASTSPSPAPPSGELPKAVADARAAILDAVEARDLEALRELIDPNVFFYNGGDASNPVPEWRADPSALNAIPNILALPPAAKRIQGAGTVYIWPYLADADFEHLSQAEIDDLHALGLDNAEIDGMRRAGIYTGPRLAIDDTGVWRSYSTGGAF